MIARKKNTGNAGMRIPLRTRIGLSLFRQYRHARAALHELDYLFWECTLRCNLSCRHCGSDCTRQAASADMPLADFLRVLDSVRAGTKGRRVMVALTGGEPLLRDDLEKCGTEITARGFAWGMVSNGYALTRERFNRLVGSGLRSLTISLDGLDATHAWMRRDPESFYRAIDAIGMAAGTDGLVFDVVTCVSKRTLSDLPRLRTMLADLGVRRWRLTPIFPKGRAAGDTALDVGPGELRDLLQFIQETRGAIRASFGCEGFLGPFEGRVRDGFFSCKAGISIGSVLADGSISACPSLRGDFIQGNMYRDDFMDVWNTRFGRMRDRTWTRSGECARCTVFPWCEGNGLHLRTGTNGEQLLRCHHSMLGKAL